MEQPTKQQKIENRIFTIRGTQVMIDRELVTNCDRLENMKHASAMPHAFTEQGVAMLSAVLHSETAVKVSIQIIKLTDSHDRFLIIDNKELYHFGASLKDLGKKWFAFSRMDSLINELLNKLQ